VDLDNVDVGAGFERLRLGRWRNKDVAQSQLLPGAHGQQPRTRLGADVRPVRTDEVGQMTSARVRTDRQPRLAWTHW